MAQQHWLDIVRGLGQFSGQPEEQRFVIKLSVGEDSKLG